MKGLISWFASNHVAANLLMVVICAAGLMTVVSIKQEVFPEVEMDMITIRVPYLGATPSEVEEAVSIRVEEAVQGVNGLKKITSTSSESIGMISLELESNADKRKVLDEVKAEVDRIITFPAETEKPIVTLMEPRQQVLDVVVYGEATGLLVVATGFNEDGSFNGNILTGVAGLIQVNSSAGIGIPGVGDIFSVSGSVSVMFNTTLQDQVFNIPDAFLPLLQDGDPTSIVIYGSAPGLDGMRNPNAPASGEVYITATIQAEITIAGALTLTGFIQIQVAASENGDHQERRIDGEEPVLVPVLPILVDPKQRRPVMRDRNQQNDETGDCGGKADCYLTAEECEPNR